MFPSLFYIYNYEASRILSPALFVRLSMRNGQLGSKVRRPLKQIASVCANPDANISRPFRNEPFTISLCNILQRNK